MTSVVVGELPATDQPPEFIEHRHGERALVRIHTDRHTHPGLLRQSTYDVTSGRTARRWVRAPFYQVTSASVDIREPTNPTFAGCYEETRVHDVQCLTYDGPDTRFTGRELCITSTGGGESVGVVDVTDKTDPVTLSLTGYPNSAFSHQGSLLDGHRFYVHDTESTTRTPQGVEIFDMADLTNPVHVGFVASVAQSTEHNLYQSGRYLHQSNYSSGLRIYDSRNVADGTLEEVGFFDVYPPNDDPGFGFGTWSNFPFDSGVVAIHGYQGLWLVKPRLGRN